jgi:hypothetical protein
LSILFISQCHGSHCNGDPQAIDAEIVESVRQQAAIDPQLRARLTELAALTQAQLTPAALAQLRMAQTAEQVAQAIRAIVEKQRTVIQAKTMGGVVAGETATIGNQVNVNQSGTGNQQHNTFNL